MMAEIKNTKTRASAGGKARAAALSAKERKKLGSRLAKARAAKRTPERIAEISRNIRLALAKRKLGLEEVEPVQLIQPSQAAVQMCQSRKCWGILFELATMNSLELISTELAEHLTNRTGAEAGRTWIIFHFKDEAHARTAFARLHYASVGVDWAASLIGPDGLVEYVHN